MWGQQVGPCEGVRGRVIWPWHPSRVPALVVLPTCIRMASSSVLQLHPCACSAPARRLPPFPRLTCLAQALGRISVCASPPPLLRRRLHQVPQRAARHRDPGHVGPHPDRLAVSAYLPGARPARAAFKGHELLLSRWHKSAASEQPSRREPTARGPWPSAAGSSLARALLPCSGASAPLSRPLPDPIQTQPLPCLLTLGPAAVVALPGACCA